MAKARGQGESVKELTIDELVAYRQMFNQLDSDGDGLLDVMELRGASQRLGYRLTNQQIQAIFISTDLNSDGKINFEEYLRALPANTIAISKEEHDMAEVRRKFAEFDRDGSGTVTVSEAHEILEKELAFNPQQSAEMVAKFDQNGDGQLGFEEFVQFYSKVRDKAQQVKQLFVEFDKDNSGSISTKEVRTMFARLNVPLDDVDKLVAKYDVDKDGELQYFEFVALLMNTR